MREQYSPAGVRRNRGSVRRGLETMRRYAHRRGIPFLVVLYPHLTDEAVPWLAEAHRRALRLFANLGLRFIDMSTDYAARGFAGLRRASDDLVHPNPEGHALAARKLVATFPAAFATRRQPAGRSADTTRATTARQPVGSTISGASSGTTSASR
jgi:lysophospholipase L1-like esterase